MSPRALLFLLPVPTLALAASAPAASAPAASAPAAAPAAPAPSGCFAELATALSADEMEGRGVDTAGLRRAADLLEARFKAMKLKAPEGGYRQPFSVQTGVNLGPKNALTAGGKALHPNEDFVPLGFSNAQAFGGDVVFAGYGITAKDLGYDDYAGLDVKGKVVLVMRYEPGESDPKSPFDGARPTHWSDLRFKAIRARELGAAALVFVSPAKAPDEPDKLPPLKVVGPISQAGLPVLQVTRAVADAWLGAAQSSLAKAQAEIDGSYKPASRVLPGVRAEGVVDLSYSTATVDNIVGVVPGRGALAHEIVVVGAHYDHLGHGGRGSMRPDSHDVHNGADDNASGVAAMVCGAAEVAKAARKEKADRRTLVVTAFAAEEIGLGGSSWWVDHPPVGTLADVVAMVNLDMVGRLREDRLSVLGTDSAPEWAALLKPLAEPAGLTLSMGGDGYGPSDQMAFFEGGVPVIHLFTGSHEQYHTPDDDAPTLNMEGGERISRFLGSVLTTLGHEDKRLTWTRSTTGSPLAGDSRGYGAYFGSVPDYSAMEATSGGVKLGDVRPGSPAEAAGLRKGDVIVGMAGVEVQNLYDMTFVLRDHRPNETVDVVYLRDGQRHETKATLGVRPSGGQQGPPPGTPGGPPAGTPGGAPAAAPKADRDYHASFDVGSEPAPAGAKGWVPTAGKDASALLKPEEKHLRNLRRLTFGGDNAEAYWSPDGRHLVLQRKPPEGGCDQQYVFDLTTGKVDLLSSGNGRTTCGYYTWPAGDAFYYATTEKGGASCPPSADYSQGYVWSLYNDYDIVRDDGKGNRSPLLASPGYDAEATSCFKDGRIVFTSTRDGDIELYTAKSDGSGVKRLTELPGYDGGAFYTQDCSKIVWRASRPTGDALLDYQKLLGQGLVRPSALEIYVMNADGTGTRQLTKNEVANFGPYPTPDMKSVIYSSNDGGNVREFDLWLVPMAGGTPERVTHTAGFDGFPMFSPDGRWLVFASNRANAPGARDTDLYIAEWVP